MAGEIPEPMDRDPRVKICEFYLVALPGLEDLVEAEVREWFPNFEVKVGFGGVTVMAPLGEGLSMNQVLKTPTRILLRVASFTCRDFPKLFKKVSSFNWSEWVNPNAKLIVHAASSRSRLKIKSRIEETCLEAWAAANKNRKPGKGTVSLYVRINDDMCTLSLDTSGERLHKRGDRQWVGEAPLRETIAAALIQLMARGTDVSKSVELIDPMMGSGVFPIEALSRDRLIEAREFAFETFAAQPAALPQLLAPRPRFEQVVGYEVDHKAMKAAKQNLFKVQTDLRAQVFNEDFFSASPRPAPPEGQQRWVIANPPYGERLKVKEPLKEYYVKFFAAIEQKLKPDRVCLLLGADGAKGKVDFPLQWQVKEKRRFSNGGIPVIAFVLSRLGR